MNRPDFKEKTGSSLPGRGFLIMIVVFFTSISFALGYFVGKNVTERGPEVLSRAAEPAHSPVSGETAERQSPPEKTALPSEKAHTLLAESNKQGPPAQTQMSSPAADGGRGMSVSSAEYPSRDASKEIASGSLAGNTAGESSATGQQHRVRYTVQLGALTSVSEAKKMKAKLLKKGYKTYIDTSTNGKKHEKIYKIRMGDFEDRKEAEVLAVKLKNTEGLKTFVTPKN